MDYFAYFGIDRRFSIDTADLRRRFVARSRDFHPDLHQQGLKALQEKVEAWSAFNNQAYHTLSDFHRRLAYILELEGCMPEEGQARLPVDFLAEVMDWQEILGEQTSSAEELNEVMAQIDHLQDSLRQEIQPVMDRYDDGQSSDLSVIRDYFLKTRYLERLRKSHPTL